MIEAERGLFRPLNWSVRERRNKFQENLASKGKVLSALMDGGARDDTIIIHYYLFCAGIMAA